MRNAPKESDTVKLVGCNKILATKESETIKPMESEAVKLTGNKMEFNRGPEARDNRTTVKRPDTSRPRESHKERKQGLDFQNDEQKILDQKRDFYEHMLQLGDHESAEQCLSGLRARIIIVESEYQDSRKPLLSRTEVQTEREAC